MMGCAFEAVIIACLRLTLCSVKLWFALKLSIRLLTITDGAGLASRLFVRTSNCRGLYLTSCISVNGIFVLLHNATGHGLSTQSRPCAPGSQVAQYSTDRIAVHQGDGLTANQSQHSYAAMTVVLSFTWPSPHYTRSRILERQKSYCSPQWSRLLQALMGRASLASGAGR